MNAENTAAGVSCAEVLISPKNLALCFFVLCLFSLFPYFFHISIFLWGNWKEMSWDRVFIMCRASKFSADGKRRTIWLFLKTNISSLHNKVPRRFVKNAINKISGQA